MKVSGWDMGHAAVKAVILQDDVCLASLRCRHGGSPGRAAERLWKHLTEKTGLFPADMDWSAATGPFAMQAPRLDGVVPMAAALARGAAWLHPATDRVVNLGDQTALCVDFGEGGRKVHALTTLPDLEGVGRILGFLEKAGSSADPAPQKRPALPALTPLRLRILHIWIQSLSGEDGTEALAGEIHAGFRRILPPPAHKPLLLSGGVFPFTGSAFSAYGSHLFIPDEAPFVAALGAALLAGENAGENLSGLISRQALLQHA